MADKRRVRVAAVGDIPGGEGRVIEAEGRTLAVFNVDGAYYAIDNMCVHRGGPLGEGDLDGRVVMCPWHAWRWDVTTGLNVNNPAVKVACFAGTVDHGGVFVEIHGWGIDRGGRAGQGSSWRSASRRGRRSLCPGPP